MRIVIDMQGAQSASRFRGIGRYTTALSRAIVRNRRHHEVNIILSGLFLDTIEPIRASFRDLLPRANIRVWEAPAQVRYVDAPKWRRDVAEYIREAFIAQLQPDVVLVTSLFEGLLDDTVTSIRKAPADIPTAVVLYDLIPYIYQSKYLIDPKFQQWYFSKLQYLREADLLLSISESSRQEAIRHLQWDPHSVVDISCAADPHFVPRAIPTPRESELRKALGLEHSFIMYTGNIDYRKNIEALIRAYAVLSSAIRNHHQLAIVCSIEDRHRAHLLNLADQCGLARNELAITGFVNEQDLVDLYNLCKLFVFPSLHEGFGLPALEAMSCGAPVIASNSTSLPEVIGRDDALFDPSNDDEIAQALMKALTDDDFRQDLASWGPQRAAKFSWDASGKRALLALERLHEDTKRLSARHAGARNHYSSAASNGPLQADPSPSTLDYGCTSPTDQPPLPAELASLTAAIGKIDHNFTDGDLIGISWCISRCIPPPSKKRTLLLDITTTSTNGIRGGIHRAARALTLAFLTTPPQGFCTEPVYLSSEGGSWCYRHARKFTRDTLGYSSGMPAHASDTPDDDVVDVWPGDILIVLDNARPLLQADTSGLYSDFRSRGVALYFILHDLLPLRLTQYFPLEVVNEFEEWVGAALRSDGILCISRSVAEDVSCWADTCGSPAQRRPEIHWFHLGADLNNTAPTTGMPATASLHLAELKLRPSFLMVGTIDPRKGHMQVIGALEHLWRTGVDVNLTIVGADGCLNDQLVGRFRSHPMHGNRLFWIEECSDAYLEKLYTASSCLVAASEGEGFGLPLTEAARHGLPIIARDLSVFREVASDCAFYFSGNSSGALAARITEWLALYKTGHHPTSQAMPWISWQQSAKRIEEIIIQNDRPPLPSSGGVTPVLP